jgi:hypothetical protein
MNVVRLHRFLDSLLTMTTYSLDPMLQLVHGGAPGADTEIDLWWKKTVDRVKAGTLPYPIHYLANWSKYGKAAGPFRNATMVGDGADMGVAFIHPESRGTIDCLDRMREAKIFTLIVPWVDDPEADELRRSVSGEVHRTDAAA